MKGVSLEENTIIKMINDGNITYQTSGWGTGKISVKCRSNTTTEVDSLSKATIVFYVDEASVTKDSIAGVITKELGRRLSDRQIRVVSWEDRQLSQQKKKFKALKNSYKKEKSLIG